MFCPNCGEKIPDGSKYCEFCGTKLYNASGAQHSEVRHDPDAPQTYAAQPKKKKGCLIGCLISALIVGLVIAVIGFIVFRSVWNMDIFNTTDLPEDEYKAVCQEYTYEEIMSEQEALRGAKVVIEGEIEYVVQENLLGRSFAGYLVDITDDVDNDLVMVAYVSKKGEEGFSKGDRIKVWGELNDPGTVEIDGETELATPTIMAPFIELME
jgi:hypothetical protein